jgi:GNAT superfamily N-acetyltransferase
LLAVLAADPALGFLSTVSVGSGTLSAAVELVGSAVWGGVSPALVVPADVALTADVLLSAGFVRVADRLLAVRRLDSPASGGDRGLRVVDAGDADLFSSVLLAGYEVDGVVASFIEAEHLQPAVRRFLVVDRDLPVAAGAMTLHDDVAVLGGASTVPSHRGRGAQSLLLRHRLRVAATTCRWAVATARPGSVSAANLERAGFTLCRRAAWVSG